MFYTFSFLSALSSLILWFFFKKNEGLSNLFSKLFFGSIFVYAGSVLFADATVAYKFQTAFRDCMTLGVSAVIVNTFGINKQMFVGLAAGVGMVMSLIYLPLLQQTFPEKKTAITLPAENKNTSSETIPLDQNGELLVEIKENHQFDELKRLIQKYDLTYQRAFNMEDPDFTDLDDYYVVNIPDYLMNDLPAIEADFYASDLVDWVEENEQILLSPIETISASRTPTPTERKYGINDPSINQLWGFEAMEIDKLYQLLIAKKVQPRKKAKIAILDTGVDAQHEDIKANYLTTKELYDRDMRGHGTHCAGIAAAVTNNGKGVASFSPDGNFVEITSIKVLMDSGMGTQQTIINGMLEAADNQADVISMSLGGRSTRQSQRAYKKAVDYATRKGAIVVAAAGNSNSNATFFSPANVEGLISVSAVDTLLNRASFSNYIADLDMGIAAPGVSIYSTYPNNDYKVFNGTSMATPYVAGLVGLMKSIQPTLTTEEVYDILKSTGKNTRDTEKTGKLIFPAAAVQKLLK